MTTTRKIEECTSALLDTVGKTWQLSQRTAAIAAVTAAAAAGMWLVAFRTDLNMRGHAPIVRMARLPRGRLALFRPDPDEMIVDPDATGPPLVAALLHETIHQDLGPERRRGYHSRAFRDRAADLGIAVSERGETTILERGALHDLLGRRGVDPALRGVPRRAASSGLSLWLCECRPPIRLRVGRRDVLVRCEECGERFTKETKS